MLKETSFKVFMLFQGNQASQNGDTKTQNPKTSFDVALCSLIVMAGGATFTVRASSY